MLTITMLFTAYSPTPPIYIELLLIHPLQTHTVLAQMKFL